MASGMELLARTLGFDPVKIQHMSDSVMATVKAFDARLTTIEQQNARILEILTNGGTAEGRGRTEPEGGKETPGENSSQ